ncbi:MAG: methionine--tRNA ligase [Candidatus Omnitrophota bacterium]|jgi:methionyl-tRNA synthetase|nr:MAG: methionine--tRNA ligase [Candidatus Omnitrophota bacterium]
MSKTFYLTTAISYVNARPHIGHAYEFIASDAIARYRRMQGMKVFFLSGVDEHSAQVERAAKEAGLPTLEFCDRMAALFRDLHEKVGSGLNGFIRTSEPRHHDVTQEMLRRSYQKGDIYQSAYKGWYCYSCENYYQEKELNNGNCPVHNRPTEWIEEDNYFFKLSSYSDALKRHYAENSEFVYPETYKNEMLALLDQGLQDISVSRATTKWGVPIPWDETHVAYVWFDALSNYLTGVGFLKEDELFHTFWPANVHVIGKDINRFHSVFWPAMLMSTDIPLPRQILVHGFIYHKGEKMSKTIGNVVDPYSLLDVYGRDPLRYFLLREIAFGQDGNYSEDALITRYNADLANDLGNLFSRVLSMIKKYRDSVVPHAAGTDDALRQKTRQTVETYTTQMDRYAMHLALVTIWELISLANRYVDEQAPWALAKDEAKADRLDRVLLNLAEALRTIAVLIYPIMPDKSEDMLARLACPILGECPFLTDLDHADATAGKTVTPGSPLFPRIEK